MSKADLKKRIKELENCLEYVIDVAHYASTGPAVLDEYWDIREEAMRVLHEELSEVTE